ncbi:hypothetical protein [Ethanoligenens sp.]|uniref:hypothetical protein n=1 Tax=Ethanoligenens sp. TaxID=2099655 RepID=UPI0039ED1C16
MMLIIMIALVVIGYYFLQREGAVKSVFQRESSAEELLKKRLAAGEIDEETYARLLKTLRI